MAASGVAANFMPSDEPEDAADKKGSAGSVEELVPAVAYGQGDQQSEGNRVRRALEQKRSRDEQQQVQGGGVGIAKRRQR